MVKNELLIIADYTQIEPLSFDEICQICHVKSDVLVEIIENEIVRPQGKSHADWSFDLHDLQRIKRALRLHRDLEINITAVAILLDLLDDMEEMRAHMELIKKHYF